tara:strand:- start:17 stop:247 length:231 start_codon:yes stop_codon:yes gene_type:complete
VVEAVQLPLVLLVVMTIMGLVVQVEQELLLHYLAHPLHTQVEAVAVDITLLLQQVVLAVVVEEQVMTLQQQQEQLI